MQPTWKHEQDGGNAFPPPPLTTRKHGAFPCSHYFFVVKGWRFDRVDSSGFFSAASQGQHFMIVGEGEESSKSAKSLLTCKCFDSFVFDLFRFFIAEHMCDRKRSENNPISLAPLRKFSSSQFLRSIIKDSASFCYCAYVLLISGYSGFLRNLPNNTAIFLHSLRLCERSRS